MTKLMAKIQDGEKYIERSQKDHKELVSLEAKKKEKEQLNKEIQELMDRVKELDKEIQSLETKSKLKKDVAVFTPEKALERGLIKPLQRPNEKKRGQDE
ncbi:unnamed protein product [Ilex paraguariensis]|uniref:Uncharacterized protein n=1 Tax=Ilex paraguariensis TaxID=185542 RepID=A0ABC8TFZ3_9AQUA